MIDQNAVEAAEQKWATVRVEDTCDGFLINAEDAKKFNLQGDVHYPGEMIADGLFRIDITARPNTLAVEAAAPAAPEGVDIDWITTAYVFCDRLGIKRKADAHHIASALTAQAAEIERLRKEQREWVSNVAELLKSDRDVIRCCEGGGPESLVGSLVLTMFRTRDARDRAEAALAAANARLEKAGEIAPEDDAFITCCSGDGKPHVKVQFATLKEAQNFHRRLVNAVAERTRRIQEAK